MTDIKTALHHVFAGKPLSEDMTENVFNTILSGHASDIEIAGLLGAMAARGETTDEITGAVKALRSKSLQISAPENAIDCCGTGGDGAHTYNISTAVSFVLAGCGVPVAKHGNRASSSKSGAADVLEHLGVNLEASKQTVEASIRNTNICFLMAPIYNPAIRHVMPARKALGVRTVFNLLGPLLNPAGTKRQVIGVYDQKWAEPMAKVLMRLGTTRAWIVHGYDGLDEITTTTKTHITSLNNGVIDQFDIHPHDVGLETTNTDDLKGGDAAYNAAALTGVLNGDKTAYRNIVVLNAAAGLVVSDTVDTLKDGVKMAESCLDDGTALDILERMVKASHV